MDWGMRNRLSRIIKPSTGHAVMLAVDHGYFMGPTHKLEEPRKTIEPLLPYADAIMCTRGVLRTSVDPKTSVPIVLRVSGGASVIGESLTNEATTTSFKTRSGSTSPQLPYRSSSGPSMNIRPLGIWVTW